MVDEQVVVSDEEIKKVEDAMKQKSLDKEKEIAEKVRKELEAERKLKELELAKAELEKKLAAEAEEKKRLKEEQEKMLNDEVEKRIQEEMTRRKATVSSSNSPQTDKPKSNNPFEKYTEDQIRMAEYESEKAWRKANGLPMK